MGCQSTGSPPADPLAVYPWLYLRDDLPVQAGEQVVSIIAVGDILPGRNVDNPAEAFQNVQDWLGSADLTIGNLECALAPLEPASVPTQERTPYTPILLSADPQAAQWLHLAGFDVLNLANNHTLDAGIDGLEQTVRGLETAGIQTTGVWQPQQARTEPLIVELNGIRIAFLGANAIPKPGDSELVNQDAAHGSGWQVIKWDTDAFTKSIQAARGQADVVIVSVHWGYEFQHHVDPAQELIARAIFRSGADLILGHHPHVVQPIEIFSTEAALPEQNKVQSVAYSLGNFVFDQGQEGTDTGLALRILVDLKGIRGIQSLPIQAGPKPRLLPPPANLPPKTEPTSEGPVLAAFTCDAADCTSLFLTNDMVETVQGIPSGIFAGGSADLTGDGNPESITLADGQITILSGGEIQWQSPGNWQVVDLAVGDPDQDGREDILAAFWKPDANGTWRSHPFVIRQQAGRYEEVWGGSSVSDPIQEVEVADLDGDGLDELIVLEQHPASHQESITVWRWHGWGFSLNWRSPEGIYENLRVVEIAGKPALVAIVK